jgi:1-aminocyclopropane-1-carboxylate deaminase/D-cysteine desulfhydrase-like pyridoxal-dependent ACC family enzyme
LPQNNSPVLKPAPVQQLVSDLFTATGVELLVKREDLIDPELGGNKWHKLKYNLQAARQQGKHTLLTFGGAWSNHIYATAAAGKRLGLNTIGVIRGEQHAKLNPTLSFARDCGMRLHYVDRQSYRKKDSPEFIQKLHQHFGDFYLIPEGGNNALAMQGCCELAREIAQPFDVITCACGTGTTLAGISLGLQAHQTAIGFAVLKRGEFLREEITHMLSTGKSTLDTNWQLETGYHFGGYARCNETLLNFMRDFERDFGFALDAVYTAKMFYGVFDMIKKGQFKPGTRILALHSGGLQGNAGVFKTLHYPQMNADEHG